MTRARWGIGLVVVLLTAGAGCRKPEPLLKVMQRSSAVVAPGVTLKIGDIRMGESTVVTVTANGAELAHTEARVGDVIPFARDGQKYEIQVVRFEDHLAHEDWAYFAVKRR